MANNRIVRYVTNTALLAVLAAAGIGVYQLGTSGTDVEIQEEAPSYLNDTADNKENEDSAVDAGTSLVEAEMKDEGTDTEKEMSGVENTVLADNEDADQTSVQTVDGNGAAQSAVNTESVSTSASAEAAPKLSFSEDTLTSDCHTNKHLISVLDVRHIRCQAGYDGSRRELINVGKSKGLYIVVHILSQVGTKSYRRASGNVCRQNTCYKLKQGKSKQNHTVFPNGVHISKVNSFINDFCHTKGNGNFKGCFQDRKQNCKYGAFFVFTQAPR